MSRLPMNPVDASHAPLRLEARLRDMEQRLAVLEKSRVATLRMFRMNGANAIASPVATVATDMKDGTGGSGLGNTIQDTYTPPVNGYWDIEATGAFLPSAAGVRRVDFAAVLSVADLDGRTVFHVPISSDIEAGTTFTYRGSTLGGSFRLAAGTAYTVKLQMQPNGAVGWSYFHGNDYLSLRTTFRTA